jgi:iron complex transport system substrate-binding protein
MKTMKKTLLATLALLLLLTAAAGCAPKADAGGTPAASVSQQTPAGSTVTAAPESPAESVSEAPSAAKWPVTVTDLKGRKVEIKSEPKTVVSLAPSLTEILFALGAGDLVKGVDGNSNYPAEAKEIEKVGDFNGADLEKITALKPDVVFAGTMQKDAVTALEKLGIPTVVAEADDYEGIYTSVAMTAEILGKKEEGAALIAKTKDSVEKTAAKGTALKKHPSAYYVISYGSQGNWTSGPGSFINTLLEKAGFTCATADGSSAWMEYPLEQLLTKNPDVLLLSSDLGKAEDLAKENVYKELSAVKNGKVYPVDANILSRPGVRVGDAMDLLYGILEKNQ